MSKKKFKDIFFSATAWVVWLAILLTAALMVLQYYSPESTLPQETMAWGLAFIVGGYTGTDRIAMAVKSKSLDYGKSDSGDISKLRWIIIVLFFLVIEAIILQVFFQVKNMAIETLIIAFSMTAGVFTIGNKAIRATEFLGDKVSFISPEDPPTA